MKFVYKPVDLAHFLTKHMQEIAKENTQRGWWAAHRTDTIFVLLFLSELIEAFEGIRKEGLMDTHLPHHPNWVVELADLYIRCQDYLGHNNVVWTTHEVEELHYEVLRKYDWVDFMDTMSAAFMGMATLLTTAHKKLVVLKTMSAQEEAMALFQQVAFTCYVLVASMEYDFFAIVNEKRAYNGTRPDHKPEARELPGGKKC